MVLKSDVKASGLCNGASDSCPSYRHHPLLIVQLGRWQKALHLVSNSGPYELVPSVPISCHSRLDAKRKATAAKLKCPRANGPLTKCMPV
jgi:hypothetical protein